MAATHSNNSILRESIRLVGSGAAGQVVALLLLAVIGRQYDQETMGVLGSFLSWGGLLAIASGARYEQGIVVANAEDEAHTLYHLALRISLIFSYSSRDQHLRPSFLRLTLHLVQRIRPMGATAQEVQDTRQNAVH